MLVREGPTEQMLEEGEAERIAVEGPDPGHGPGV